MPLLKNRAVVSDDPWTFVKDEDALPPGRDVVVSLTRFKSEADALASHQGRVGVQVEPTDAIDDVATKLAKLPLLAIHFPKFGDGRGYSHARRLRERFGFKGELRAIGEVLTDQLFYMMRCGFDAFALVDGKDVEAAIKGFEVFSVTYQAATDEPQPLYRRVQRG
jgi:uncharacterized protein (DUF934 family)